MRIVFDAKRAFVNETGLGNYSRILLNAFMRDFPENEYLLFTPKVKEKLQQELQGNYQLKLPKTAIAKAFHPYWRSFGIVKDLQNTRPEIFHGLSNELPFFHPISFASKIKKIVTIHDLIFLKHQAQYPFLDRKIYEYKTKYAAQNADHIIVPSIETKNDLMQFYKTEEQKILVVYQSCAPIFYETKTEIEKQKVSIKYDLPKKFILNVSSFHPRKNQLQLIKAFEKIKDKVEEKVVLVGNSGKMFSTLQNFIAEKNLQNDVLLLTTVTHEDLPALYQLSSVFVYPSILEGFGIPILEALFSKTPVITSLGGCMEEAGGKNSLYIITFIFQGKQCKYNKRFFHFFHVLTQSNEPTGRNNRDKFFSY